MVPEFTKEERVADLDWHIDSGFINPKKCFSSFGDSFLVSYNKNKRLTEEYPNNLYNEHVLVRLALEFCKNNEIDTLGQVLQNPSEGAFFCSIELFAGNEEVHTKPRIKNEILFPYSFEKQVYSEFSTEFITCDTGRYEQGVESKVAIIGKIYKILPKEIIVHPIIMGVPTFDSPFKKQAIDPGRLLFEGPEWYEVKPEDIENFANLTRVEVSTEEWQSYMRKASENDIKEKLCSILGEESKKDWGGELNDHFSTSILMGGKRFTAAFLFKGPAGGTKFKEMQPNFLGKNGDQISRLCKTPAELVILQHCHEVGEAVRETLKVFAIAPHIQKRCCVIDGRDTYKILKAYGKL
ncbi:MAG: hypothetical protein MUC49_21145 [Raineya sp.]|jgi:hypothetical protein|nr:hypothetical protein [Raineya sp.]